MGSVLIVDDIAGNARLIESLLAPDGHAVRTACDGAEALRLVRDDPPDLAPDGRDDAPRRRVRGVSGDQAGQEHAADSGRARHLAPRHRESHPRHRGRRGRFHQQAVQRTRAPGARPLVAPHQALHRRARQRRIGDRQPRADHRSARQHDRRPLPASRALRVRAGPDARARRGRRLRARAAAASFTMSGRSASPMPCC